MFGKGIAGFIAITCLVSLLTYIITIGLLDQVTIVKLTTDFWSRLRSAYKDQESAGESPTDSTVPSTVVEPASESAPVTSKAAKETRTPAVAAQVTSPEAD